MHAIPEAAIFRNTTGLAYLAVCGQSSWAALSNSAAGNRPALLQRYVETVKKQLATFLKTLADENYTTILTGHFVSGTVAVELSGGIYHVRTFGSVEIGPGAELDQHLVRHYRLQGDSLSQRNAPRYNVKTMRYQGTPEEARSIANILLAMTGSLIGYDPRTLDDGLDLEGLKSWFERNYPLAVFNSDDEDTNEDNVPSDEDEKSSESDEGSSDELARRFMRNKRPANPRNLVWARRFRLMGKTRTLTIITKPRNGMAGLFIDDTTTTATSTTRNGTTTETVQRTSSLNAGAERGLGIGIYETLQLISDSYSRIQEGKKIDSKFLGGRIVKLLTDIGEGYLSAQAGEIIAAGGQLHEALPQAVWAMSIAYLVRNGYNIMTMSSAQRKKKWANLKMSDVLASSITATASIARTGLQLALVGLKNGYAGPAMFGADLVVNSVFQLASTLVQHGLDSKELSACAKAIVKSSITAGAGVLASIGTAKAMVYLFGSATTVGMSVLTVGLGAVAFFAAKTLCERYLWGSTKEDKTKKEEQDYHQLLRKYNLPVNATLDQIKKKYRKLALELHPDRGGSAEDFKQLGEDIDKLTTLFLLFQSRNQKKDAGLFSLLQRGVESLQSLIRHFLNPKAPVSAQEVEEQLSQFDDNQPNVMQVEPRARQRIDEAMDNVGSSFFELFPGDLLQYAARFTAEGYGNEQYLLAICNDEAALQRIFQVCGVTLPGHQDRIKHALRELKNQREQALRTAIVPIQHQHSPQTNTNAQPTNSRMNGVTREQSQLSVRQATAEEILLALPYYSLEQCMEALEIHYDNMDLAINWLLDQQGEADYFI